MSLGLFKIHFTVIEEILCYSDKTLPVLLMERTCLPIPKGPTLFAVRSNIKTSCLSLILRKASFELKMQYKQSDNEFHFFF